MRIGLISDTHIPEAGPDLWPQAYERLQGCDLILHGGDLHVVDVLDRLERLAPVYSAKGNGDWRDSFRPHMRPGVPDDDQRVKEAHVLTLQGFRIGLTHAFDTPEERPDITPEQQMARVFGQSLDIVVCGDTHVHMARRLDNGLVIVNPGSVMMPRNLMPQLGTLGYLELSPGRIEATILDLATGGPVASLRVP
ncbi:MAG: metallophosphoesterase family protein [Chloroflexi bacterium]|nr:metallophosphoesterase family protein [Chloroflexota bacterium]